MKIKIANLIWGILLVAAGVIGLAYKNVDFDQLSAPLWMAIFIAIAVLGLITYLLYGVQHWGWLFPVGVFGGLAVTIWLAEGGLDTGAVASPIFIGLIIPFLAAYLLDRKKNWWALLPAAGIVFLIFTTLLESKIAGEYIGAMFLFLLALSFLVVYLNNTRRIWAAIVAGIVGVIALAPLLSMGTRAEFIGPILLLAIAIVFYFIYFRSAESWWALIPAGTLTMVGIIAALAITSQPSEAQAGIYQNVLLPGGLAVVFAILWLRHKQGWAKWAVIILAALILVTLLFNIKFDLFGPLAVILVGLYLLYNALRKKQA